MTEEDQKTKQQEIMNQLYELEKKKCDEYTNEENLFFYQCYHHPDPVISQLAGDVASKGMIPYIQNIARKMILERGADLTSEDIEEVFAAGSVAFASKLKTYDPIQYPGVQLHSYAHPWMASEIDAAIDEAIKGMSLENHEIRIMKWMKYVEPKIVAEIKKTDPTFTAKDLTAQDFVNRAKDEKRPKDKYNLDIIKKIMDYMNYHAPKSIERMEENGQHLSHPNDIFEDAYSNIQVDRTLEMISKMGYFNKMAIKSKMNVANTGIDVKKGIQKATYDEFKKLTQCNISQKDFERLLTDAQEELSNRLKIRKRKKITNVFVDNSLSLDNSFDYLFDDKGPDINQIDIQYTLEMEFNEKYPEI